MIREYMSQIDIAVLLSYSVLVTFLTLFVLITWYVWKIDNDQIKELEQMPLDLQPERR
ncbi:hypothetical protein UABAM_03554 [Candidatus Uabimicrobium amorphum]|uniref:CcoQ/FixQ family Cbb3-type cytochrome c oxidase assembly chaperone n=1 Tax=Uabimicrobium amorphum TaxID=2596890 RepID=A0A5S9IPA0_UABAM|nr:hypothetical protein UABAM_03554 [Candidatus Uabimicrobium amorphum]